MKKLLNWLKSLFIKSEAKAMTDTTAADTATTTTETVTATAEPTVILNAPTWNLEETATPAAEVKAGVQDFEAALSFVESGVAQLGEAAKDELKELAKKYL